MTERDYSKEALRNMRKIPPEWIVGFVDADGCFSLVLVFYDEDQRRLKQAACLFAVAQSVPREWILNDIKQFFGCGNISDNTPKNPKDGVKRKTAYQYHVWKIEDIITRIIPFFDKYPPILKLKDYEKWREAAEIIGKKKHKSIKEIKRLIQLRSEMHSYGGNENKGDIIESHNEINLDTFLK